MSSTSRKAEKRKAKKEKKRQEIEKQAQSSEVKYDVMQLLKTEQLDSKPNFYKFLKSYVRDIRCFNGGKIQFYPEFKYDISKVFVTFLDGHELIYYMHSDGKIVPKHYYSYKLDEIELKSTDVEAVQLFFDRLFSFKVVS